MAQFYLSPLVDVNEIDQSATIAAVATSIGVLVIRNPIKGKEFSKTLITNDSELIDTFGKPLDLQSNYVDMLSAVGALKNMNMLYCVAVKPADATFSGVYSTSTTSSGASASFLPLETSGEKSIRLDNFTSLDPDDFADEVNPDGMLDLICTSRGTYGNNIRVAIVNKNVYDEVVVNEENIDNYEFSDVLASIDTIIDDEQEFILIVQQLPRGKKDYDSNWETVDWHNVSINTEALDDQGVSKFAETLINTESDYIRISLNEFVKDDESFDLVHTKWLRFSGGSDGDTTDNLDSETMDALDLFSDPEEIDINILIDSDKSETVKKYMLEIAEDRKDCMAILDCNYEHVINNKGSEVTSLVNWRKGLDPYKTTNLNVNTSYAALYGNWLEVYDRWNKKYRWIPASGHVASKFAYTDDVAAAWFAPAGLNRAILTGIRRLAFNPNLGKRNILYKNGINPITSFSGQGQVIWGQKTLLNKSSAFDRINVRRLFIVLEKAISTSAKYFIFEPNDGMTRLQLKNMIEPFLRDVKGGRGIYDFLVVCDDTNNTPERIDRNELHVDIYIKPTKAAEFIKLNFIATKTGASFTEITNANN